MLFELRQALFSYQDYRMLLLTFARRSQQDAAVATLEAQLTEQRDEARKVAFTAKELQIELEAKTSAVEMLERDCKIIVSAEATARAEVDTTVSHLTRKMV